MRKAVYTYAWDYLGEGVDTVLERVKAAGCREVIVAMAYHAGRFLLPHNPKRRIYYPEDGVVYFEPDGARYAGQRLKPAVASIFNADLRYGDFKVHVGRELARRRFASDSERPSQAKALHETWTTVAALSPNLISDSRDLMGEIISRAKKLGLDVTAWFVCFHNSRLGFLHPDIVARNAFGDPYYHYLCPMNEHAAGYVLNLLGDFTSRYAVSGIFLESFSYSGFEHGYHHEFYGVTVGEKLSALLGLCFCNSCRKAAKKRGIDVERLAGAVRRRIAECIGECGRGKTAASGGIIEELGKLPGMKKYLKMRCERVGHLLSEARRITAQRKMRLDYFGPVFAPVNMSVLEGIDLAGVEENIDRYVLRIEEKEPEKVEGEIRYAKRYFKPEKIVLSLRLFDRATPSRQNLAAKLKLAEKQGLAGCNFYNYGMVPLERLNWLKGGKLPTTDAHGLTRITA